MAVSQEYLSYIDNIYFNRLYRRWETEEVLDELNSEWNWLKEYWQVDKRDAIDCLLNLACVSYELLSRFTNLAWYDVLSAAKELHERKNAGYSPSETDAFANFRECTKFGISAADGCLVRLSDKYTRFFNVYRDSTKDQVGESAIDTLRDLAAYSIILVVLLEENND